MAVLKEVVKMEEEKTLLKITESNSAYQAHTYCEGMRYYDRLKFHGFISLILHRLEKELESDTDITEVL